jgi:hypothetical protein
MAEEKPTPDEQVRHLYEESEAKMASAAEELVGRDSFGELLARFTENAMAVTRIGNDVLDLAVRNLRIASRQDVTRLARPQARTEDKLELVLQQVERLEEGQRAAARERGDGGAPNRTSTPGNRSARSRSSAPGRSRSGSGSRSGGSSRSRGRSGSGRRGGSGSS